MTVAALFEKINAVVRRLNELNILLARYRRSLVGDRELDRELSLAILVLDLDFHNLRSIALEVAALESTERERVMMTWLTEVTAIRAELDFTLDQTLRGMNEAPPWKELDDARDIIAKAQSILMELASERLGQPPSDASPRPARVRTRDHARVDRGPKDRPEERDERAREEAERRARKEMEVERHTKHEAETAKREVEGSSKREALEGKRLEAERVIRKSEVNLKIEPVVRRARRSLLLRIAGRIATWIGRASGPMQIGSAKVEEAFSVVRVFFATDRRISNDTAPQRVDFGDGRGDGMLTYGIADVSIPPNHRIGKLERPLHIFSLELKEDLEHHIVITKCEIHSDTDWSHAANNHLAWFGSESAIVFIHGYNVSFADAIRRAGQIGRDLRFEGVIAAYSWASEAAIKGYLADDDNVKLTVPLLLTFLRKLRASGATTVHIIAHSMGNRALLDALKDIEFPNTNGRDRFIGEVVLAAPDLDAKVFERAIAELKGKARRYTLYGSAADAAIKASKAARGYPRAGDGGDDIVVVDDVESIDVTAVGEDLLGLGHSYFADKRLVLDDIFYVIREALPAAKRAGLAPRTKGPRKYWIFEPN